ncbi:MAG TPA: iron uptake transporter permease EfeU [Mycobacteriales bacterium]|nr:iron uptake transporter permease EfeU [Mycobacteriales bacterium]
MLGNFIIGLREGLEASLVVGILVAYLVRTGHRDRLKPVWAGVLTAVALSAAVGAMLTYTSATLSGSAQEAFAGVTSLVAVTFVTWMIFWMRRTSRFLSRDLQGKLAQALTMGTAALALTAFLAVGREGLETAVFLWSAIQATSDGVQPVVGALLGIAVAVVLGYLIYKRSIKLNLATFFKVTGAGLVVVAAGVLSYGVHDMQEGGLLPGLNSLAFDVTHQVPLSSWYGALLHGIIGFTPDTTWLQLAAFVAYVVPVMVLFFRQPRTAAGTPAAAPSAAEAPAAATPPDPQPAHPQPPILNAGKAAASDPKVRASTR